MTTVPAIITVQDYLDTGVLPQWLSRAPRERLTLLGRAIAQQHKAAHQVQAIYQGIMGIEAFAAAQLEDAVRFNFGVTVDVLAAEMSYSVVEYARTPDRQVVVTRDPVRHSLLEGALLNVLDDDSATLEDVRFFSAAGEPLAIEPEAFTAVCRGLDIGQRYQAYLHDEAGFGATAVQIGERFADGHRAALQLAACLALCAGDIGQAHFDLLMPARMNADSPAVEDPPQPVLVGRALRMLGKPLQGVIAFEVHDAGQLRELLCWIPGDEQGALKRYESWDELEFALAAKFRLPGYGRFFRRFVGARDKVAFDTWLGEFLATDGMDLPVEPVMEEGTRAESIFPQMARQQMLTLLDDARLLAVPTQAVDLPNRLQRIRQRYSSGLFAGSLASPHMARLGLPMLAVMVHELVPDGAPID